MKLDKSKNVRVVSQTTFNYKKFQDLVEIIKKKSTIFALVIRYVMQLRSVRMRQDGLLEELML